MVLKIQAYILIMVFCTCHLKAAGQNFNLHDTIKIPEVVIRKTQAGIRPGFTARIADSVALKTAELTNIGDILSWNFPVFIKSNGPGGISTTSLRGASPSQAVVQWNGININNPMLGQSDLSIVQTGMTDEISVSSGAGPGALNTGAIGGTINLNNKPDWENRTSATAGSAAGSYGRLSSGFRLATGTKSLQSVTRTAISFSRNDFKFHDPASSEPSMRNRRENSQIFQKAFLQELYLKRKENTISARVWYQTADRNIPSPVIIPQSDNEKQKDESIRLMLDLNHSGNSEELSVKTALSVSRLDYTNTNLSVFSRNTSRSWFLNTSYKLDRQGKASLELLLDNEITSVSSSNYQNSPLRLVSSLAIIADAKFGRNVEATFAVKEILNHKELLSPNFSALMVLRPFNKTGYSFFSGISRNIRIPTMNELYWMPGGNTGLQNESAMMYEAGTRLAVKGSERILLKSETVLYANQIRNMIQWHPSEYSYWIAGNAGKVNVKGIETDVNIRADLDRIIMELSGVYSYKRAMKTNVEDEAMQKMQLLYIPVNQANSSLSIYVRNFYARLQFLYTGRRYITTDNSDFLPSYALFNIMTGIKKTSGKNLLALNLRIENILNEGYQSVKWYPQPGTSWVLSLSYNFNNTNSKQKSL